MANEIDIRVDSNPSRQGIRRIEQALVAMGRTADRAGQQANGAFTRLYEQIRLTAESAGDLRSRIDALSGIAPILQRLSQAAGPSTGMISSVRELINVMKLAEKIDGTALSKAITDIGSVKVNSAAGGDFKTLATGIRELKAAMGVSVNTATITGMAKAITTISAAAPDPTKTKNLLALGQAMQTFGNFRAPRSDSVKNFGDFVTAMNKIKATSVSDLGKLGTAISKIDASKLKFTAGQATALQRLLKAIQGLNITTGTGTALQGLAAVLNGLANQANAATNAINATAAAAGRGTREFRAFGGQIGSLSSFIGRTEVAFRGFVAILGTNAILREVAVLQKFESGLTAIGGASSFAAVEMRRANEIADRFGIALGAVSQGYSQMLAAANSSDLLSLDEARSIFEGVSQAVRVFGLSTEDAEGVYRALTQIVSKGSLQMEELRGQLGDRLPGAVAIFARGLGVSTAQLIDMTKAAEVTGDTLKRGLLGFSNELKSITDAGVGEASTSVIAELGRLSTAFTNFAGMLGKSGFSEAIINISQSLRGLMSSGIVEGFVGGLGAALSLATNSMWTLSLGVVLLGTRFLFTKKTMDAAGLATSKFSGATDAARVKMDAMFAGIARGTTATIAGFAGVAKASPATWAGGAVTGLRAVGTGLKGATMAVGSFAKSLFALALTNPFTTIALGLMIIPPLIEAFTRGADNARASQDALNKSSEIQAGLLLDISGGAEQAAKNYAKLTEQQRLQEKIKLDSQIDQLSTVRTKQEAIISGWNEMKGAAASDIIIGKGLVSKPEDEIAIGNIRAQINRSFQEDKKIEVSLLKRVQKELVGVKEQYGTLSASGQIAFDSTTESIQNLLEGSNQLNEAFKHLEASGLDLTKLPPHLQGLLDFFGKTEEGVRNTTTALREMFSVLERPPSIEDLKSQIDKVRSQMKGGDMAGAAMTLRSEELRNLAGTEDFGVANEARILELTKERLEMLTQARMAQTGLSQETAELFFGKLDSGQVYQDALDYAKMILAEEQLALEDTLATLKDDVNKILNPSESRTRRTPAEQELNTAKTLLESLDKRYAAENQLKETQAAISLLREKDAAALAAMGGQLSLNLLAMMEYKKTMEDLDKAENKKAQDARRTAIFGSEDDQKVKEIMDSMKNLEGKDKIIADYKTRFQELFITLGYGPKFFIELAQGVKDMNAEVADFDADKLKKDMEKIESVLDKYDRQLKGTSRDAERRDLNNKIEDIQKLISGGELTADAMNRATMAVRLLNIEMGKLTVVGDVFQVGLDSMESGLNNLMEALLGNEVNWRSWGQTIIRELYQVMIVKPIIDWISSTLSFGLSNVIPGGVSGLTGSGASGIPAGRMGPPAHTGGVLGEITGLRGDRMHTGGMTKTMMERMSDVGSMIRGNEKLVNILAGSEVIKYGDRRNSQTPKPTIVLKNEEILGPNHPLNVRNLSRTGSQGSYDKMHTGGVSGRGYAGSGLNAGGVSPAPVVHAPSQHLQRPMALHITTNLSVTDNGGGAQGSGGRGLDPEMLRQAGRQLSDNQRASIMDVLNRRETGRSMKVTG